MGLWDSVTGFFEDLGDFFSGKDFFECAGYAWNDMMKLAADVLTKDPSSGTYQDVWDNISTIYTTLNVIAVSLLCIFFLYGFCRDSCDLHADLTFERTIKMFIRLIITSNVMSMALTYIEEILRTGGGKSNSRKRIYFKYHAGNTPKEMEAFLREEYGKTGKGFLFGEEQISVWFDENGMYAAHGTSALEHTELHLSWSAVESVIRGQMEAGTYIDSNEACGPLHRRNFRSLFRSMCRRSMMIWDTAMDLTRYRKI